MEDDLVACSRLFLKVGCWLQLAVTVLDWYQSHRHRAAQVVDQAVYQTSIRREWMDPVLCMCQSILVQDAESQFAPDIHRSVCVCVCVTKDWFVYHDHHPQYNPVSPVTPDFIFYLFAF